MTDNLTVSRVRGPTLRPEVTPVPRLADPASGGRGTTGHPNPTLRLDPALGVVVVAFHDEHGEVTTSIPTQQQLDAYRTWERTQSGPKPGGSEA